ncbi:MAG: AI-2E family transporter [Rhizobiaceae bacterium]
MTTSALQKSAWISVIGVAALVTLIYGRGFLVPIVLAVLLYGLLTFAITKIEHLGAPTWLATVVSVGLGLVAVIVMGAIVESQFGALNEAWPQYLQRFDLLLLQISALTGPEFVETIKDSASRLDIGGLVSQLASSTSSVFNEVILICLYTGFLLAERGIVVEKIEHLVPNKQAQQKLEKSVSSIARGVRRYLSIKATVSAMTGILTFVVARYYEVHFAELTGLLAFLLNFIPVIGSAVAVVIPFVLAILQFDTLGPTLQIAGLLILIQAVVGNVIEPKLMGRNLNLSPFIVIVALTFWSTIWGIAGAFLSVPITASVVIVCRDIKSLRWIAILLSVDGVPEVSEEKTKPSKPRFIWPFSKSGESEKVKLLREELEAMKQEKARETKAAAAAKVAQEAKKSNTKPSTAKKATASKRSSTRRGTQQDKPNASRRAARQTKRPTTAKPRGA